MAETAAAKTIRSDVAIVGGGLAGGMLAALLGAHELRCVCIDRDEPASTLAETFDGRTTAISFGSRRVLEAANIWKALESEACPIKTIEIKDSGSPTLLEFLNRDVEAEAFGWTVENRRLRKALYDRMASLQNVMHIAPAQLLDIKVLDNRVSVSLAGETQIEAQIVIGADGRNSFVREKMGISTRGWSYRQRGIACVVRHENPHNNMAVEDFRAEGPFAILPMSDDENGRHRSSIVWTEHGPEKTSSVHWDETVFNAALAERFPVSYGKVELAGKRFSYPLSLSHAHSYTAPRMALVADAAHGIHPIAGQGLNMGLRDIAALSEILIAAKKKSEDLGGADLLREYERLRRFDNMAMAAATDALNKLFSNDLPPLRMARKLGLRLIQRLPAAREFFMRQAMGSSGHLPSLIRDGRFKSDR